MARSCRGPIKETGMARQLNASVSIRKGLVALAAAVGGLPGLPVFAQGVELLPRAAIFGNPSKTQGLVSPDGKLLSWIAPMDGVLNVWGAQAADSTNARPLTVQQI